MSNPIEYNEEVRKRIQVALWAYSYEFEDDSLVSDGKFDKVCEEINLDVDTGNDIMDTWFRNNFEPHTGQWIHNHPDLIGLKAIYDRIKL